MPLLNSHQRKSDMVRVSKDSREIFSRCISWEEGNFNFVPWHIEQKSLFLEQIPLFLENAMVDSPDSKFYVFTNISTLC